jgi:hypothetical protein
MDFSHGTSSTGPVQTLTTFNDFLRKVRGKSLGLLLIYLQLVVTMVSQGLGSNTSKKVPAEWEGNKWQHAAF